MPPVKSQSKATICANTNNDAESQQHQHQQQSTNYNNTQQDSTQRKRTSFLALVKNVFRSQQCSTTTTKAHSNANTPIGILLLGKCYSFSNPASKRLFHKLLVLALTFIAYATSHMDRRPLTVVKTVLNQNCTNLTPPLNINASADVNWCDWAPFDNDATADQLFGLLDGAFLGSYALTMFFVGAIAERQNLRYLLTTSLLLSGVSLIVLSLAKKHDIHSLAFFVTLQVLGGASQSIAWPVVVTCVANWFVGSKRGLLFAAWNSHTNVGNIIGLLVAGAFVSTNWMHSFAVPGHITIGAGILVFLFLVPQPRDVHLSNDERNDKQIVKCPTTSSVYFNESFDADEDLQPTPQQQTQPQVQTSQPQNQSEISTDGKLEVCSASSSSPDCATSRIDKNNFHDNDDDDDDGDEEVLSFTDALLIPGVIEYSLCLFFTKLVNYTLMFWLPQYIKQTTGQSPRNSSYLSIPFDVGGLLGSLFTGLISDLLRMSAIPCLVMLVLSMHSMFAYDKLCSSSSTEASMWLLFVVGAFVNGPYCLITTSISANLGSGVDTATQSTNATDIENNSNVDQQRKKRGKSMASVVAIIDGSGSVGAFLGPTLAPLVKDAFDWEAVFYMLIAINVCAILCLIRLSVREFHARFD